MCGFTQLDNVIDLTADKPPAKFVMLIDLPTDEGDEGDDEGGNAGDDENTGDDGNTGDNRSTGGDGNKSSDGNEDEDMVEDKYEEGDVIIYDDDDEDEDEWVDKWHLKVPKLVSILFTTGLYQLTIVF